ncbi:hypothetical protein [Novilysobacter antarcticus]|uniref:hypothetical protein n=1 Tax=Novilysobacter antarcticus TaxID=2862543 RepID=UPI001C990689|nr:hypothetical protein [Lysobacter antarcticus]
MKKDRSRVVLIQKKDGKSSAWARALPTGSSIKLRPLEGSPIHMPIALATYLISRKDRPVGIVFRYLNDYPSLLRTLVRSASELFTLIIAILLNVRVGWICHNVDKESEAHFPWISKTRRWVLAKAARRVFVTSDLLLEPASKALKIPQCQLGVATFGRFSGERSVGDSLNSEVKNWVESRRASGVIVGLWIGSRAEKSHGGLQSLVNAVVDSGSRMAAVVVGASREWVQLELDTKNCASTNIMFLPAQPLHPTEWREFDFVWKPCSDVSTTVTSLIAAEVGVPLIVHKGTYLHHFVEHYSSGFSVDPNKFDFFQFSKDLSSWSSADDRILADNTWERGAAEILRLVEEGDKT